MSSTPSKSRKQDIDLSFTVFLLLRTHVERNCNSARITQLVNPVLHPRDIDVSALLDSKGNTARKVGVMCGLPNTYRSALDSYVISHISIYQTSE